MPEREEEQELEEEAPAAGYQGRSTSRPPRSVPSPPRAAVAALEALLAHIAPDADLDAEVDNLATKRDGTMVYIGDLQPAASAAPAPAQEERSRVKPTPIRQPGTGRQETGPAKEKDSLARARKEYDSLGDDPLVVTG